MRELAVVTHDYKELEISYGDDALLLVIAAGFLERLLSRRPIEQFLATGHLEVLETFRGVIAAVSLEAPPAAA
ncbi:hypothetical protein [Brevundimonas mediterranea]|uniref:Uncharacterized protein n=1 Tax=Brevundimonas mediterranea TaxID=74329 RepID=A0A7Z8Y4Q8_9CAUL|nr:hypothetical protein BREV_BREV_00215 [Brevundimonas mediterranea]